MGDHPASRDAPSSRLGASALRPPRWVVRRFSTLDSTNRWLLDEARGGAAAGLVALADHQAAGRGRRGRRWSAPTGSSLLVSVLLRPAAGLDELHVVTMRAALALVDALESETGVRASLKWPNDLVVGDRKIAGLLSEADLSGGTVSAVVVGIGCNLSQSEFPEELAGSATSVVLESGSAPDRDTVLAALLGRLDARLDAAPDAIRTEYRSRLSTLGRVVRVKLDDRVVVGEACDVDPTGRLVVEQGDGERITVGVGDVVHVRPA